MDEENFSSSSSHNKTHQPPHHPLPPSTTSSPYYPNYYSSAFDPLSSTTTSTPTHPTTTTTPPHYTGGGGGGGFESSSSSSSFFTSDLNPDLSSGKWATNILLEAARAASERNTSRLHQLLWTLNELGSPYGDVEQKLASYFNQALFTRMTNSGERTYRTMHSAVDKTFSFDSTRKMVLKFQEVSPWTTFGHVAANGALIDAFDGESKIHIIDISTSFCTQWPTLLEALATRMDDAPHLRLTTVVVDKFGDEGTVGTGGSHRVMREIGTRLEKFARLMGVPFKFNVGHHVGDLSDLDFSLLDINSTEEEALAINCVNSLHSVNIHRRDSVLASFRRLNPRVITVVEEEADFSDVGATEGYEFYRGFSECLRW